MFRANSVATKALDLYMKVIGMEYLNSTIGEVIKTICEKKQSCEVDPMKLVKGEDPNQNWPRLVQHVTTVWNHISKSASDVPMFDFNLILILIFDFVIDFILFFFSEMKIVNFDQLISISKKPQPKNLDKMKLFLL